MKLVLLSSELNIHLNQDDLTLLVIENPKLYESVNRELYNFADKINDTVYIIQDGEKIDISKLLKWINSPFDVYISKKETQKQLFKDILSREDNKENLFRILEYSNQIASELENISLNNGYPFEYKAETEIEGLLKLYDVQIKSEDSTFIEGLIDFIHAYNDLLGTKYFIISNCIGVLKENDLMELRKMAQYLQVTLLLIDYNDKYPRCDCCKTIIDIDLCELH